MAVNQTTVNPPVRYYSHTVGLGLHVVYIMRYKN